MHICNMTTASRRQLPLQAKRTTMNTILSEAQHLDPCKSKVTQLDNVAGTNQDVLRLHVAMHDSLPAPAADSQMPSKSTRSFDPPAGV
eukprot:6392481-Amphidinium_carterae.1